MNSPNNKLFPFESILQWYKKNGRHTLPWRQVYHLSDKERLYHVWIAEVMLQQTQVERVIGYYNRFIEKYPTIESLAETSYEELFPYYQGLGYYGRARRMIELAQVVVEKYNGLFPDDFEQLRKLPGIGSYTAQALLAFGYNQPILALDANLQKIFSRYYFGTKFKKIQNTESKIQIEGINICMQLQKQLKKESISGRDINNALMDFGAFTSNLSPINIGAYPLENCDWFETQGRLEQVLKKVKKRKNTKERQHCLVFLHKDHKRYWSSHKNHYEPFLIAPTDTDNRKSIQDYFTATYGLEVSVRPSFGNGQCGDLKVQFFHAQIQTGIISLTEYSKQTKEEWFEKNITTSEE